jgi:hypothetical protein
MITNKGNQIISKYLLGQAPEFAAYIAVGVGAAPLDTNENDDSPINKKSMEFEAFRVPVVSRGLVNDYLTIDLNSWSVSSNLVTVETASLHGAKVGDQVDLVFATSSSANLIREGSFSVVATTSNTISYQQTTALASWSSAGLDTATLSYNRERMIFKAQLPSDQRYEMTEVALFPATNNTLATNYDSRVVAGFLTTEGWTHHDVSGGLIESDNTIPFVTTSIVDSSGNIGSATFVSDGSVANALFINSNNEIFTFTTRKDRYEHTRFLNRTLIVPGNMTTFSNDEMAIVGKQKYIFTNSLTLNLGKNSPDDYVKFAFSILGQNAETAPAPNKVRLRFEFLDSLSGQKAIATHLLNSGDLAASNYIVLPKQLKDFDTGTNFSWGRVDGIVIYAQTLNSGGNYDGSYIAFDGIRIDNENTENPLYGMVAYSRMKNGYLAGQPIEKLENSQGYIEYRLGVNIV